MPHPHTALWVVALCCIACLTPGHCTSVAFVSFLDDRAESFVNGFRLAQSIRTTAGVWAQSDIHFYTLQPAAQCVRAGLASLGVKLGIAVPPAAFPSSLTRAQGAYLNKLLALFTYNSTRDVVIYLDLDVLVLSDFSEVALPLRVQSFTNS